MNKENKNEFNDEIDNFFKKITLLKNKREREYFNLDDNNIIESDVKILNKNNNNEKNNNFLDEKFKNNEIVIKNLKIKIDFNEINNINNNNIISNENNNLLKNNNNKTNDKKLIDNIILKKEK